MSDRNAATGGAESRQDTQGSFCDLCGGGHLELMFMSRDRLFGIDGEFPLVKCQDCGLIFISPRPSFAEMGRFYPLEDYDLYQKAAGLRDRGLEELGRLHGPRKGRIEKYQPPGTLLDIGFGDGSFLYFMKETGWEVTGIDFNEKMVEAAKKNGIKAIAGQLQDAGFKDGEFDVVTLWGVLEHVQSPRETIEEVSRITSDQALLVIYTQNAAAPEAKVLGSDWFIYEAPRHLYSFDSSTLSQLLASGGFKISEIVYETPLYYCQMNWQYFKERLLKRKNDVVHNPTLVDRAMVKGMSLYRKMVNRRPWSSAMTVYAVKQPPEESLRAPWAKESHRPLTGGSNALKGTADAKA